MQRILGFMSILWGALLLRLRVVRPEVDSVEFFAYRRRWGQRVVRGFGIELEALGDLPRPGTLVIANHSGFADIVVLEALLPAEAKASFISKIELARLPLLGWHMRHYKDILVDRGDYDSRHRAAEEALLRLTSGFSVVVFPEGTRSRVGRPKETVHPALLDAAIAAGVPIQPVGIIGSSPFIEHPLTNSLARHQITVRFGRVRRDYRSATEAWSDVVSLWAAGTRRGSRKAPSASSSDS